MGGVLVASAPLLLVALLLLVPRDRRQLLRFPLFLFAISVVLVGVAWLLPSHRVSRAVWVAGYGSLLLFNARAALLLVTQTRLSRRVFPPISKIVADIAQGLLYLAAAVITLHSAGIEAGNLFTTSAVLTAVLGLALQETLGNLFSGLALQLGKAFDVGDWVELDGSQAHTGRVVEVGWRATKLLTLDDVEVIIPNGFMAKALIRNLTRPTPITRRKVAFSSSYSDVPGGVVEAALGAVRGVPGVLATPAPSVILLAYGESSMDWSLRYYSDDVPGGPVTDSEVRTRLWYRFRRENLTFPFPQRDVRMVVSDAAAQASRRLDERLSALQRIPILELLDPESLALLAEKSETRLYGPGESVVVVGEPGADLFGVLHGELRVLADQAVVARLGAGDFFGEMSLLTGEPRAATVVAGSPCELVVVGHDALQQAFQAHPELMERLSALVSERQLALEAHRIEASVYRPLPVLLPANELLSRIRTFFQI